MCSPSVNAVIVLNVDHDEPRRRALSRQLRRASCVVHEAASGAEALQRLGERPHVALLRMRLPDMSGPELAGRIQADPLTAVIPVIHLTDTANSSQKPALEAPLVEPVDTDHLVALIQALQRYCSSAHQTEERYRAALRGSGIRMGCQDRDGRYTWIYNPGPGLQPQDVIGKTDADLVSPEDAATLDRIRQEVLATGRGVRQEVTLSLPTGQRVFDISVEPDWQPDQTIQGICVSAIDVTDHKRVEGALAATAQLAERTADQMARLQAATAALAGTLTQEAVAQVIVEQAVTALQAKAGLVSLLTNDQRALAPMATTGYPPGYVEQFKQLPRKGDLIAMEVVSSGEAVWLETHAAVTARAPALAAQRLPGLEALAMVPLQQNGRSLGVLVLSFATPRHFDPNEQALLRTFAQQCAQALERAHLYETEHQARQAAEQTADRLVRLQAIAESFSQALTAEQVSTVILQQGVATLAAAAGMVYGLTPDGSSLVCLGHIGYRSGVEDYHRLPLSANMPAPEVARTGQYLWFNSYPDFVERYPLLKRPRLSTSEAVFILPLTLDDRILGALVFNFPTPRRLQPSDRDFALTLARHCAQALSRARVFDDLEQRVERRTAQLRQEVDRRIEVQRQLERSREAERSRIARELHDELGGALTVLKLDLKRLDRRHPDAPPSLKTDVSQLNAHISETISLVRRIATELRPALLDSLGLVAALDHYFKEFVERSALAGTFEGSELDLPVSSDQATACFRIFQEALTNVARHAHATHVRVRVQRRDGQAIISVGDNGRGLDEAALAKTGHLGLVGMRERAASVSASLEINGEPGKGTRVILHVPLSEAEAR